jgi:hypothetical protein
MKLEKFSLGIGDRFGREGVAQLAALQQTAARGVEIIPVWNKSNREHNLIGTSPEDTRRAAEFAVKTAGWRSPHHLDADHIGLKTVDRFLPHCDFYTIDVADFIGQPATPADQEAVRASLRPLLGKAFPSLGRKDVLDAQTVERFLSLYAFAVREAGRIYRHIEAARGRGNFIAEVSTDEAETSQSPLELFLILGALAGEGVWVQTIAPKFTGRFNKGVDYVGEVRQFAYEFEQDLIALQMTVAEFGLPINLKISVHSGSDKFSLYGLIRGLLRKHGAGPHLKTAGTSWLEEVIGLALAGGNGLVIAKDIYAAAFGRIDELSKPYATVIDIDRARLPVPAVMAKWDGAAQAAALTHNPSDARFNSHLRQLGHVSFKVAAEMGKTYLDAIEQARATITPCVTGNLYDRYIRPLFIG